MKAIFLTFSIISITKADLENVPLKEFNKILALKDTSYLTAVLTVGDIVFTENINKYYLFTQSNPEEGEELCHGDVQSVKESNFDKDKRTVFLSHGYDGFQNTISQLNTTKAILENHDYNVIRIDWSKYAEVDYVVCALVAMPKAASDFADFIVWLNEEFDLSFSNIHMIGLSLGSHLVSIAAHKAGNGAIKAVTGFDPVKFLFEGNPTCINKNAAEYVKIIHTTDEVGIYKPLGHIDFYFNGGRVQPQCENSSCGHIISWRAFSASVEFPLLFPAYECDSLCDVDDQTCSQSPYLMRGTDVEGPKGIYLVYGPQQYYPYKYPDEKVDEPKSVQHPKTEEKQDKSKNVLVLPKKYGLI